MGFLLYYIRLPLAQKNFCRYIVRGSADSILRMFESSKNYILFFANRWYIVRGTSDSILHMFESSKNYILFFAFFLIQ